MPPPGSRQAFARATPATGATFSASIPAVPGEVGERGGVVLADELPAPAG
jgi:hypothetical protein